MNLFTGQNFSSRVLYPETFSYRIGQVFLFEYTCYPCIGTVVEVNVNEWGGKEVKIKYKKPPVKLDMLADTEVWRAYDMEHYYWVNQLPTQICL